MTLSFDEAEAAAALGFPGEPITVTPYRIDGVYWVTIGEKLARPVLAHDGHIVRETGYAVGAAWLRRLAKLPHAETSIVAQVLSLYDALPLHWSYVAESGEDEQSGDRGRVTLHPIEIRLVSAGYVEARPRNAPSTNGPSAPGGYAPPVPCRARLVEIAGKLTWISETYDADARTWTETLREAAED